MIVEIHGAGFQNKGAELMLRTVVDELARRLPACEAAIDPTYGPYRRRCGLSLRQMFPRRTHVGSRGFSRRFSVQKLVAWVSGGKTLGRVLRHRLSLYGCDSLASVQGLIDIAGFAYTDDWGPGATQDFAALTSYYKAKGRPIILLPQALGPFRREETRSAFRRVLDNATLVYARDRQSREYALDLSPESGKLMEAPDITLFYPRVPLGPAAEQAPSYMCLVPNVRMLDQGKEIWGDKYLPYLTEIARESLRHDVPVHVVVHDASGDDLGLARHLCAEISSPAVTLVQETDPIALKRLLAGSLLVVGSRYHSLVAAFSQGVPALALGWSHKYAMLLRDFGCENYAIPAQAPLESVLRCVRELADRGHNAACREGIACRLQEMSAANQTMWDKVIAVLTEHAMAAVLP